MGMGTPKLGQGAEEVPLPGADPFNFFYFYFFNCFKEFSEVTVIKTPG